MSSKGGGGIGPLYDLCVADIYPVCYFLYFVSETLFNFNFIQSSLSLLAFVNIDLVSEILCITVEFQARPAQIYLKLLMKIYHMVCYSFTKSCLTFCDPHGLQRTRLLCVPLSPGVGSNSSRSKFQQVFLIEIEKLTLKLMWKCYSQNNLEREQIWRIYTILDFQIYQKATVIKKVLYRLKIDGTDSVQFSRSVALTLQNTMNCRMPGFPVLHYVPEFAQTQTSIG